VDAPRGSDPHTTARRAASRRSFIEWREVPGLLVHAALGRDVALRRVIGARRGGRIGAILAAVPAWLAATDLAAALAGLGAYAGFAALTAAGHRRSGLGGYRALRLLLWTLPGPLLAAAATRGLGSSSRLLLPLAVGVGWALLERGLRRGLAGPPVQSRGAAGASPESRTCIGTGSPGRE
jgi:hypothetical protein